MWRRLYLVAGGLAVALFFIHGFFGWNPLGGEHSKLPPEVRNQPGGYRSSGFWNTGYQGGK